MFKPTKIGFALDFAVLALLIGLARWAYVH